MKKVYLILSLTLISAALTAQHKITVLNVRSSAPVAVNYPLLVDSVNFKGEKFSDKDLLASELLVPKKNVAENFTADSAGNIFFPKAQKDYEFRLLTFGVNTDRFSKLKITVTSPAMFELWVNDKKETSKTNSEDSLQTAKNVVKELNALPGTVEFAIKYLSKADSKTPQESVNIVVETTDSLCKLTAAGSNRFIRINDILEGTRVTGASISPSGRFAVINYSNVVVGGDATRYSKLFDTKTKRSLHLDKPGSWLPTSEKLYCTAQRGENNSLLTIDPETLTESVLAVNVPKGGFRMAPNEKYLLYNEKESYDERKGDLLILKSPADRQSGYLDRYFVYKYELATGVKQRLTFGRHTASVHDISRDSRYLLLSVSDENFAEPPFHKQTMFVLDLETMQTDTLWKDEKYAGTANFSPDGKNVIVTGAPQAFGNVGLNIPDGMIANSYETEAYIVNVATKQVDAITKNFAPSINRMNWISDDAIYFTVTEADYENAYKYSVSKQNFTKLNLSEDVVRTFSVSRNGTAATYTGVSASNPAKAYSLDLLTGKSSLIDYPLRERFENITLGDVRDWNFTSSEGVEIKGRYYLPPCFDQSKKYPLIVYYYGGTSPTARTLEHSYPLHVYAALGYVVYTLQPSGTVGFGQEFSARHVNAWGKRTADEIIEGVKKFAAEHSFVNDSKIGCIGASYGGFMTMYLQTVTDIFAAAVSHAGISSIASYWGEGYWGYAYSTAASAGSYPWNNHDLYVGQSPLFNADKIKTPLLLLHGMDDTNVPIGESIQMFTALKILGRPVEFIRVKGENHGIATYNRRIEWNRSIYAWFAKWLQDDSSWWNSLYPEK